MSSYVKVQRVNNALFTTWLKGSVIFPLNIRRNSKWPLTSLNLMIAFKMLDQWDTILGILQWCAISKLPKPGSLWLYHIDGWNPASLSLAAGGTNDISTHEIDIIVTSLCRSVPHTDRKRSVITKPWSVYLGGISVNKIYRFMWHRKRLYSTAI